MRALFLSLILFSGLTTTFLYAADPDRVAEDELLLKNFKRSTEGAALLDSFRQATPQPDDRRRLSLLVKQLGVSSFRAREKASAELVAFGPRAVPLLREALKDRDPEVVRRARDCLRQLESAEARRGVSETELLLATARLIAVRRPAGAVEVLLAHVPFAAEESVREEISRTLGTVAFREGKPDPALLRALTAPEAPVRASAGAALARAGGQNQRTTIRKLLKDPSPEVRLRVGLALTHTGEKEAIPVLIDLLGELAPESAQAIEELLQRVAQDRSPQVALGTDADSRQKCRTAWARWWHDHGGSLKLGSLTEERALLGYTLIVTPDAGSIVELDRTGKPRWEMRGLRSPFFAQVLPGERILTAEYAGRVTERNTKGEILWEKQVALPVQCQRLPGGKTMIVTVDRLLEVDAQGDDHTLYARSGKGSSLVAARRLRTGDYLVVESDGTCLRLDARGKERRRFSVGSISNNCLDVLPNGHLLVPHFFNGKLTEYSAEGKVVWEVELPSSFSAQRLPNGHTLVACHSPARVVELDRAGKVVWERKAESPNFRPWFVSRR